jgi:hypothetical protein
LLDNDANSKLDISVSLQRYFGELNMGKPAFEIGVVMAGAVSAGAYSAGVMDFIMEALDAYEEAKSKPDWDGPTHDVRIPVLAGASAGGMTSAISALHAFREGFQHVWPEDPELKTPQRKRNRLYSSWVEDIDIDPLLETTDLDADGADAPAKSLLCCDVIDRIVRDAFDIEGGVRQPNWIGRGDDCTLRVFLTLTNLRGVPYSFQLFGTDDPRRYGMLNHGDFLDFRIGVGAAPVDGAHALDIRDTSGEGWDLFREAAKATGAFPIGLAPRRIKRTPRDYTFDSRVGFERPDGSGFEVVPPDSWIDPIDPYAFVAVDGGTIDNEPLEIARRYLSGAGKRIPSDGVKTDKAIILIAPFPNFSEGARERAEDPKDLGLANIAKKLFSTLIDQARFKPDELSLAVDDRYYSRYIIAPERKPNKNEESTKYPIACGVLEGFGGFLHHSFRRHDYLLGRRNAQAFLRWSFVLPESADLFQGFTTNREKWFVRKPNSDAFKYFPVEGKAEKGLPIIPLTETMRTEIRIGADDLPDPDYLFRPDHRSQLDAKIKTRARKVVSRIVDVELPFGDNLIGWLERIGAKRVGTGFVVDKAGRAVTEALDNVRKAFFVQSGEG